MSGKKRELEYAFPKTVPVLAGYLVLGAAYGILMADSGFGPLWSVGISMIVYAGSLQYLGVSFLAAAVNPVYAFLMSFMLNARHLFYGISMLDRFRGVKRFKPYLIFALTDETFSVLCSEDPPEGLDRDSVLFWITFLNHCYWVGGTVIGALLGSVIAFDTSGMDFALTALFVVIFTGQWEERQGHPFALLGLAAAGACLLIFGQDNFIIPAMAVILAALFAVYRKQEKGKEEKAV